MGDWYMPYINNIDIPKTLALLESKFYVGENMILMS